MRNLSSKPGDGPDIAMADFGPGVEDADQCTSYTAVFDRG